MKLTSFTYTKDNKSVSKRVVAMFTKPTHLYAGTDISELSDEDQACYVGEMQLAHDMYMANIAKINEHYDTKTNYRQFKPENMTDVIEE
jgi:hypothetical protein